MIPSANAKVRFPLTAVLSEEQQASTRKAHQTTGAPAGAAAATAAEVDELPPEPASSFQEHVEETIRGGAQEAGPTTSTTTTIPTTPLTDSFLDKARALVPIQFIQVYNLFHDIVWYKPPVGIVSLWVVARWYAKMLNKATQKDDSNEKSSDSETSSLSVSGTPWKSEQALLAKANRLDCHTGRALDLDKCDMQYQRYGGIERVRRRLLYKVLKEQEQQHRTLLSRKSSSVGLSDSIVDRFEDFLGKSSGGSSISENAAVTKEPTTSNKDTNQQTIVFYDRYISALTEDLEKTFTPGGSYSDFVNEQLQPMTQVEESYWALLNTVREQQQLEGKRQRISSLLDCETNIDTRRGKMVMLLELAHQTAETRMIDSLLRLARDRLIRTTFRLGRTVRHWQKRVQLHKQDSSLLPRWAHQLLGLDGDRMRLAFAEAAYSKEVMKLGKVVNLLVTRPYDMDDSALELAVQATTMTLNEEDYDNDGNDKIDIAKFRHAKNAAMTPKNKQKNDMLKNTRRARNSVQPFLRRLKPNLSNMSVRFNADGRGKVNIQYYDDSSLAIDARGAMQVLLKGGNDGEHGGDDKSENNLQWLEASRKWNEEGREALVDILQETVDNSVLPNPKFAVQAQTELQTLRSAWCHPSDYDTPQQISDCWKSVFQMTRELHQYQRIGDGQNFKLKDVNFLIWFRQFDLLGIPSAMLKIVLAYYVHTLLLPYFPRMTKFTQESFAITKEIVMSRFYTPVKDLLEELMFRDTSNTLMEGFSVSDEEESLDNMLRDLNFCDGSPEQRPEGMRQAMRQYESDMNTGMLWHSNRLVRLILIQVQQLKVGMLHATDTVDLLYQANRFNFQLLTIIPAIVIVTVGTKLFVRALFTLRAKDIRPIRYVHAEMTEYLHNLESILLLARNRDEAPSASTATAYDDSKSKRKVYHRATKAMAPRRQLLLTDEELGEFVNTLYDYLVLLDSSSPEPFPSWQCDGIHQSITELLQSMTRLTLDEVSALIDQVKRKHIELAKHL